MSPGCKRSASIGVPQRCHHVPRDDDADQPPVLVVEDVA
jgi:hypothetical protein